MHYLLQEHNRSVSSLLFTERSSPLQDTPAHVLRCHWQQLSLSKSPMRQVWRHAAYYRSCDSHMSKDWLTGGMKDTFEGTSNWSGLFSKLKVPIIRFVDKINYNIEIIVIFHNQHRTFTFTLTCHSTCERTHTPAWIGHFICASERTVQMSTISVSKVNPIVVTVALICPPFTDSSGGRQIAAYIEHSAVSTAESTSEQAQNTTVIRHT